ncbi:MAG TPA: mechanosensitive ion channel [Flavobacteriales bacterium]|nr:mechanosensitive ion channel [Flavobacteriales bacterium]
MNMSHITDRLAASFNIYLSGIIDSLPTLVAGLIVLIVGWLLAKLVRTIVRRALAGKLDSIVQSTGMNGLFRKLGIHSVGRFTASVFYGAVLVVFVMAAADIMGMERLQAGVAAFIAYLPTLLTALTIFVAGLWAGEKVTSTITALTETMGLNGGRSMARVLGGLVVLFISITALNVAGVDTELITSNLQIILAGVLLAFGLAYAYASRDILTNILSSFYGKERFKPGMRIRIGEDEGVIERIDSISLTLRTQDREVLIPTSRLITERIEVLERNE